MKAESHYSASERLDHYLNLNKRLGLARHVPTNTPRTKDQQMATFAAAWRRREQRNARRLASASR